MWLCSTEKLSAPTLQLQRTIRWAPLNGSVGLPESPRTSGGVEWLEGR